MQTFNKVHVFSNHCDNKINESTEPACPKTLEHEAKRQALLMDVQKKGGLDVAQCHQQ